MRILIILLFCLPALVAASEPEKKTTSPHADAIKLVMETQAHVIASVDSPDRESWWFDTMKREWTAQRTISPGYLDTTHWFTVTYKIDGRVVATWTVDTRAKTVQRAATKEQATMTPEQFRKIVESPSDNVPLIPELQNLPFWPKANLRCTLTYADGKKIEENATQEMKTVQGRYMVFSGYSELYKQTMHTVVNYDEGTASLHQWSIYGDSVIDSHLRFQPGYQRYFQTSSYGDGFTENTIGSYTDKSSQETTSVYKDGKLFLNRKVEVQAVEQAE